MTNRFTLTSTQEVGQFKHLERVVLEELPEFAARQLVPTHRFNPDTFTLKVFLFDGVPYQLYCERS